jgi:outer membrane protein assembly factor BamD
MKFLKIFFIFFILINFLSSCSSDKKTTITPPKEKISLPKLYSFAMDDLNRGNAEGAIEKFKLVEKDYSFTEWAPKATLMISYVYYLRNRCTDSIMTLDRYIKFYPGNQDRVYAEYLKGVCFFEEISDVSKDQEKTHRAIKQFNYLMSTYPKTDYADDAKYKMDLLNDNLAGKEMYIARYYMNKEKWTAALSRLQTVVEKYQTTIYVEEALHRMVEIYYKLGLNEEAKKTASILGHNYNKSDWYKKSYSLVGDKDFNTVKKNRTLLESFKKVFN